MKIPFVSFEKMHDEIKDELTGKFQQVLAKNWFIQGEELAKFEEEYAAYCGVCCARWKESSYGRQDGGIWNGRCKRCKPV